MAAAVAVAMAREPHAGQPIADVSEFDIVIENGAIKTDRAKPKVSFKFEGQSPPTFSDAAQ